MAYIERDYGWPVSAQFSCDHVEGLHAASQRRLDTKIKTLPARCHYEQHDNQSSSFSVDCGYLSTPALSLSVNCCLQIALFSIDEQGGIAQPKEFSQLRKCSLLI
jgi:hypothetical protein